MAVVSLDEKPTLTMGHRLLVVHLQPNTRMGPLENLFHHREENDIHFYGAYEVRNGMIVIEDQYGNHAEIALTYIKDVTLENGNVLWSNYR